MEKKIQQHYVWEHYLSSWCYNSNQLYCYRTNEKKIFPVNPVKISKEREFYKLQDITHREAELIELLFIREQQSPELRQINRDWIKQFTEIFRVKEYLESQNKKSDEIDTMIDILITNLEEEHHTNLERMAIPYLESIKNGQLNMKDDDRSLSDFLLFLTTQYTRTKKIKMNVIRSSQSAANLIGLNMEKIWNIVSHIFATSMAYTLYTQKIDFKWSILINNGNIPFITGDQPVINTLADYSSLDVPPAEFELYYPISPDKALLISKVNYLNEPTNIEINEDEVIRYNSLILEASEEQVFSNSKETLILFLS